MENNTTPMTLLERMEADATAFRLFNHSFESEILRYIINKGKAIYADSLYDLQLSELVKSHITENLLNVTKLGLDDKTGEIQILMRECNLLCDYIQTETKKVNKEVGRYQ